MNNTNHAKEPENMSKTIFLMTAAEESHLLELSSRIDGALHAEPGETPQDFAKRLMDKEAVTASLQAAGIDTGKEAEYLKKKAAIPSFTVTMFIDNTATADSRERLFIYTSKAPTTPTEIAEADSIIEKYKGMSALKRTAQAKILAEIREALISCKEVSIHPDSKYLPFALWHVFTITRAVIGNVGKGPALIPQQIISVGGRRIKSLDYPIDKVNSNMWKQLERDMHGQIAIGVEKTASKREINILYSINFDALGEDVRITRRLEPFDKRVYIAVAALFNAGNEYITIPQIYDAMGHKDAASFERRTTPGATDVKKIAESISKMAAAHVFIDNAEEAKAYKYDLFRYDASLLPMERATAFINGQEVKTAIHLFREPPLVTFARERKQITTIDRRLLNTPLHKTNETLMLEDYLLERIAHAKAGKLSSKILFTTIYGEARITEKKQKQRAPQKIYTLLDYYKKCGHIKGYKKLTDGVQLEL